MGRRGDAASRPLAGWSTGIIAIKESINTTSDSAAALFRRMLLANGTIYADSTNEMVKADQEGASADR